MTNLLSIRFIFTLTYYMYLTHAKVNCLWFKRIHSFPNCCRLQIKGCISVAFIWKLFKILLTVLIATVQQLHILFRYKKVVFFETRNIKPQDFEYLNHNYDNSVYSFRDVNLKQKPLWIRWYYCYIIEIK